MTKLKRKTKQELLKLVCNQLIIYVLDEEEIPEPRREDLEVELEMTHVTDSTQDVVDAAAGELGGVSGGPQGAFSPGRKELHASKGKRTGTRARGQVG